VDKCATPLTLLFAAGAITFFANAQEKNPILSKLKVEIRKGFIFTYNRKGSKYCFDT
jgi:hypothetical protein